MPNTSIETAISTSTTKTRRCATYPIIDAAPLNHFPLIPAQAGIQGQELDPRVRGDERVFGNSIFVLVTLQRDALQLQPLHRRRVEILHLLTDAVHVSRRVGDDPRPGFFDHGLEPLEQG